MTSSAGLAVTEAPNNATIFGNPIMSRSCGWTPLNFLWEAHCYANHPEMIDTTKPERRSLLSQPVMKVI